MDGVIIMGMSERIEQKIREALPVSFLDVVNESAKHVGHAGDDGSGESHFKVVISSIALNGMPRVNAQRRIYQILEEEMGQIHAISIKIV